MLRTLFAAQSSVSPVALARVIVSCRVGIGNAGPAVLARVRAAGICYISSSYNNKTALQ